MKFFNLGLSEIIFIIIIALIIFGPGNLVKTAREAGELFRKITKSPYWQEIWATRRELNEIPKMLAKEANLNETIRDLNRESNQISSSVASTVSDLIKEFNQTTATQQGENLSTKLDSDTATETDPTANSISDPDKHE